jgi:hypothetical protein
LFTVALSLTADSVNFGAGHDGIATAAENGLVVIGAVLYHVAT